MFRVVNTNEVFHAFASRLGSRGRFDGYNKKKRVKFSAIVFNGSLQDVPAIDRSGHGGSDGVGDRASCVITFRTLPAVS